MPDATLGIMQTENLSDQRIRARDAASRMLSRLTAGLVFGAVAGVGLLGAVSANTIPGATTYSGATASSATSAGTMSTSSGTSSSTGLQASPTSVGSSSSSGVAVSGGS